MYLVRQDDLRLQKYKVNLHLTQHGGGSGCICKRSLGHNWGPMYETADIFLTCVILIHFSSIESVRESRV